MCQAKGRICLSNTPQMCHFQFQYRLKFLINYLLHIRVIPNSNNVIKLFKYRKFTLQIESKMLLRLKLSHLHFDNIPLLEHSHRSGK